MIKFVEKLISRFQKCNTLTWSSSLAYYTALSMAPLIILLLSVTAVLGNEFLVLFKSQVFSLFGEEAFKSVDFVIINAKLNADLASLSGVLGLFALLISASLVFGELKSALDVIFKVTPYSKNQSFVKDVWDFIRLRLINMGIVFGFIFLMIVSLIISTALNAIQYLQVFYFSTFEWATVINLVVSVLIYFAIFVLLYRFVPSRRIGWKISAISAAVSSVFFVIGKEVISLYLGQTALGSAYGAAGSIVVMLAWVYYSSLIVFMGAHVGYLYQFFSGIKSLDSGGAKNTNRSGAKNG